MTQPPQQPPFEPPSPYGQSPYGGASPPPPYGQPYGAPGPVPGPQNRKTNGFAIASLVFGIIGGVILSVIFGIIALVQINKRGQRGKGLAIAGLVLSAVWLLIIILIVAAAVSTDTERDSTTGEVVESGSVSIYNLQPGDCVSNVEEGRLVVTLPVVPCAELHSAEVFAVFDLPAGPFPGDTAIAGQSEQGCFDRLGGYSSEAFNDPATEVFYYSPSSDLWSRGDREVICLVSSPSPTTGSIRG